MAYDKTDVDIYQQLSKPLKTRLRQLIRSEGIKVTGRTLTTWLSNPEKIPGSHALTIKKQLLVVAKIHVSQLLQKGILHRKISIISFENMRLISEYIKKQ